MPAEDTNTRAWQIYGQRQMARAYTPPIPDRLGWTPWEGIGPGAEVLGDVAGIRVLDIGSGAGHHAVHLAQAHRAHVTGIELSPTQHEPAVSAHADVVGVEFVQADVTEYLAGLEPFDAAYAIGTLSFIERFQRCLSRVRTALAMTVMRFGLMRDLRKICQDFSRAMPRSTGARAAARARLTVRWVRVSSPPGGRLSPVLTQGLAPV